MNGRTNVAIQWIRKRLAGHAYTVWFGLGIVVTVAIQRFGEFIASFFSRTPFDSVAIWLGPLIAAAVLGTVLAEGYCYLLKRYGGQT